MACGSVHAHLCTFVGAGPWLILGPQRIGDQLRNSWAPLAFQRPLPQFSHAPPTAEGPVGSPVALSPLHGSHPNTFLF